MANWTKESLGIERNLAYPILFIDVDVEGNVHVALSFLVQSNSYSPSNVLHKNAYLFHFTVLQVSLLLNEQSTLDVTTFLAASGVVDHPDVDVFPFSNALTEIPRVFHSSQSPQNLSWVDSHCQRRSF